jgi:hypothetical protein
MLCLLRRVGKNHCQPEQTKGGHHLNQHFSDKTILLMWQNCTCTTDYFGLVTELRADAVTQGYFDLNSGLLGIKLL